MGAPHILLVDDQKEVTRVLRSGLESLKHEFRITDVPSGEEAFLEITPGSVDLLVSDVRLPGISGLELMRRVKEHNPDLKVILVSGVTEEKIRQEVAQAGADAFFFKPVELADFLDAVERVLGTWSRPCCPLKWMPSAAQSPRPRPRVPVWQNS